MLTKPRSLCYWASALTVVGIIVLGGLGDWSVNQKQLVGWRKVPRSSGRNPLYVRKGEFLRVRNRTVARWVCGSMEPSPSGIMYNR